MSVLVELQEERHVVSLEVVVHAQRQAQQGDLSRGGDLMQLGIDPIQQGIVEELIFHCHFLTVVKHLEQEVGACRGEQFLYVLRLVLADALEAAEGLFVLNAASGTSREERERPCGGHFKHFFHFIK